MEYTGLKLRAELEIAFYHPGKENKDRGESGAEH